MPGTEKHVMASSLTDELREGDGVDPKEEKKKAQAVLRKGKPDHAVYRLASQIGTALRMSMQLSGDALLAGFDVSTVEPTTSGNSFRVQVFATDSSMEYDPRHIKELLDAAKPRFRQDIADEINRKKVPDITFDVLPPHVFPR